MSKYKEKTKRAREHEEIENMMNRMGYQPHGRSLLERIRALLTHDAARIGKIQGKDEVSKD